MPDEVKECRYSCSLNLNKYRVLYKVYSLIWNCQHTSPVFSTDSELSNILRVCICVVVHVCVCVCVVHVCVCVVHVCVCVCCARVCACVCVCCARVCMWMHITYSFFSHRLQSCRCRWVRLSWATCHTPENHHPRRALINTTAEWVAIMTEYWLIIW